MLLCPMYYSPWYEISILFEVATLSMIPFVIGFMLWKIFVTNRMNPRGNVCVLGLTETSATAAEMYGRKIPYWTFALYVLTGLVTFKLGLLAFDSYYYLVALLD